MSAPKKSKKYNFNEEWELEFLFTHVDDKSICLICNFVAALCKRGNLERHFTTKHENFNTKFPLISEVRKNKLVELKKNLKGQQLVFSRQLNKNKTVTVGSFRVCKMLSMKKKPFEDGEYIKEVCLYAAEALFDDFKNKKEIISTINSMQLSARTVCRRVDLMANDAVEQLKNDIEICCYFSMQLDESTDMVDNAQLTIFVRMVFDDFTVKEELLKLLTLKGHTRGVDIYNAVKKFVTDKEIPLQKLVSITTDGAPTFTGVNNGFIGLCKKDIEFPKFINYHCIIHQQALCGKFLNINSVMKLVVKIINSIRARALQRRLFKELTHELECQYGDLLLYTEVRWLSKGKVLQRFIELLPQIITFLEESSQIYEELSDISWLRDLAFLTDITAKLNELNLELQGKNKTVMQLISSVRTFYQKLKLWRSNLIEKDVKHFPNLLMAIKSSSNYFYEEHVEILDNFIIEFEERFSDFNQIEPIVKFVMYPFIGTDLEAISEKINHQFDYDTTEIQEEIISLQNNLELNCEFSRDKENFWRCVPESKYPVLKNVALKIMCLFGSTYLCESTFSNMKFIKNKYRTRLTDYNLENCIRMATTNYSPNLEKLSNEIQYHPAN